MVEFKSQAMSMKNPVLGIDIGSSSSKVAYINAKGTTVEIVQNEVNNRATPTLISFTQRQRIEGDQAQALIKSNLKNTIRYFKHLLGQKFNSERVKADEFWSLAPIIEDKSAGDGSCAYEVNYMGEKRSFSVLQVFSGLFRKVRQIANNWCDYHGGSATGSSTSRERKGCFGEDGLTDDKKLNVVISCPCYYGDVQRRALIDAAALAGMQVLRIISDGSAAAISYGPYRVEELQKPQSHVAFCAFGHSCSTVAVARFSKDGLQLIAECCDPDLGARDMDLALMKYFVAEFLEKNKGAPDPLKNKKSILKLEEAVQKTKKILSSNEEGPVGINVECLIEDYDFSSKITRETFEKICEDLMTKLRTLINDCLSRCQFEDVSQVDSVEMIGGASRVPWIQRLCQELFKTQHLSRTLNADEAVVRGCALQAAIYSPLYKVWLYSQRAVSIAWSSDGEPEQVKEIFPEQSPLNLAKVLTCYRQSNFSMRAFYSSDPSTTLGKYHIEVDNPNRYKVTVSAKLDVHGIFSISDALLRVDGEKPTALTITASDIPGCSEEELGVLRDSELEIQAQAASVVRLEEKRNDLETLIYRYREQANNLGDDVCSADEKSAFTLFLEDSENWVYDNEDTFEENDVKEKILEVKRNYAKLEERKTGEELRSELVPQLKALLEAKRGEKPEIVSEIEAWLVEKEGLQAGVSSGSEPALLGVDIKDKMEVLGA